MSRLRLTLRAWLILAALAASLAVWPAGPVWATPQPASANQASTTPAELARRAQDQFNVKNYPEAARLYEQLAERAPTDPAVLYNLGTAYANGGQTGLAVWRYLQALELTPRDPDLRYNLRAVAPNFYEQMAVTPLPPVNWLYLCFATNEWAAMAGGLSILALLLGTLYYGPAGTRPQLRGVIRQAALVLLVLACVAWPFAIAHFYLEDAILRGVVVAENSVARTGPGVNQIETYPLPVGTVLRIRDESIPGWVKFSYAGGRVGFIEHQRIRSLL